MADKSMADVADKIVSKLDHVAPQAWELLVTQQRYEGIVGVVGAAILCLVGWRFYLWVKSVNWDRTPEGPIAFVCSIALAVFLIMAVAFLPSSVLKMVNPEAYALAALLKAVK